MSARKRPREPQSTGKPSKAKQPKQKKPQKPKWPSVTKLPDLQAILDSYLDAYAIVCTASHALHAGEDISGIALTALRQGIEGLDAANDRLEEAEMQLGRLDAEIEVCYDGGAS